MLNAEWFIYLSSKLWENQRHDSLEYRESKVCSNRLVRIFSRSRSMKTLRVVFDVAEQSTGNGHICIQSYIKCLEELKDSIKLDIRVQKDVGPKRAPH